MSGYSFEVRRGDSVVHRDENVVLENPGDAWEMVVELSKRFDLPGTRFVVRDEYGGITISVGVVAALKTLESAA